MKAIVLTFDCLPVRLLGCYGNQSVDTPNFDRLAASAIVFDAHFGENFDAPANDHAWWTGRYQFPRTSSQQRDQTLLQQMLSRSGFVMQTISERATSDLTPFEKLVDEARVQLQGPANGESPHLLWLKGAGLGDSVAKNKTSADNESLSRDISALDRELGRLLGYAEEYAGAEDVLFLLTASRGAPLGQGAVKNTPIIELNETVAQVPLIVRAPNSEMGSRRESLTQSVDIPSTLLDWFQVDATPFSLEGQSLLPMVFDRTTDERDHICLGSGNRERAIRTREFYLVERRSHDEGRAGADIDGGGHGTVHLFKKPEDRFDVHDVAKQFPEACDELRRTLASFVSRFAPSAAR